MKAATEADLARILRAGGPDARRAREELVARNAALAKWFTTRYCQQHPQCDPDAILSASFAGLQRAVEKLDPDRGVRLSTYAVPWMWSMSAAAARSARKDGSALRPVSMPEEGAEEAVSTDDPVAEVIAREERERAAEHVEKLLSILSVSQREILARYFGLGDRLPESIAAIASSQGLAGPSSVRRAHDRAIKQLRSRAHDWGIRDRDNEEGDGR